MKDDDKSRLIDAVLEGKITPYEGINLVNSFTREDAGIPTGLSSSIRYAPKFQNREVETRH